MSVFYDNIQSHHPLIQWLPISLHATELNTFDGGSAVQDGDATPRVTTPVTKNKQLSPLISEGILTLQNAYDAMALLVAIARLFDGHSIPYVAWGTCNMYFHEIPTVIDDISLVVPDEHFEAVLSLFTEDGTLLTRCHCDQNPKRETLPWLDYHYAMTTTTITMPTAHFRHPASDQRGGMPIQIWKKSAVMWTVDFGTDSPDIVTASPIRAGPTRLKRKDTEFFFVHPVGLPDPYPVRFLSILAMREVGLLLTIRDVHCRSNSAKWMPYVTYCGLYIEEEKLAAGYKNPILQKVDDRMTNGSEDEMFPALMEGHDLLFGGA